MGIERTCQPLDFCQFEGKAYQPGQFWSPVGDPCTTCSCPSTPNVEGLYVPVCNTECCGDCPMGHVRVADSGKCCGMCVPLSCTDEDNKQRQIGDTWSASEDKCVQCTCKQGKRDIYAECFSTRKVMLEECPEEFIYRSEDGCVENAENQLQLLEDAPFLLILSDEYLLKSMVCCVKLNETLKSTCVPVNVSPPLSTKTVRWKDNALAALQPRPLNDKSLSNAPMVPLDPIPLNSLKNVLVVLPSVKLKNQKL